MGGILRHWEWPGHSGITPAMATHTLFTPQSRVQCRLRRPRLRRCLSSMAMAQPPLLLLLLFVSHSLHDHSARADDDSATSSSGRDSSASSSSYFEETPAPTENSVDVGLVFGTPEDSRGVDELALAPTVAACVAIVLGLAVCTAGSLWLRTVAFACAFCDGAFSVSAILDRILSASAWDKRGAISWAVFLVAGGLCCLLLQVYGANGHRSPLLRPYAHPVEQLRVEIFVIGLTAGVLLAFASTTTFGIYITPDAPQIALFTLLGLVGPGCGFLAAREPSLGALLATSWIGSNMIVWGIGCFFGDYPNGASLTKFRRDSDGTYELPSAWWGYLGGTLSSFVVGAVIQIVISQRRTVVVVLSQPQEQPQGDKDQDTTLEEGGGGGQEEDPVDHSPYVWLPSPVARGSTWGRTTTN